MAIFKCAGKDRYYPDGEPYCEYESEKPWHSEPCPGCSSRVFGVIKVGADKKKPKKRLTAEDLMNAPPTEYIKTGVSDFDRVIGGGLVKGSVILFGGEKGTGKSTLLSMICAGVASEKRPVLYAMGEQGARGMAAILHRVGGGSKHVEILPDATDGYAIRERIEETDAFLFVLDSLQVVTLADVGGNEGSIAQCDAVMNVLQAMCCDEKKPRCGIIVNHLIKGGDFAGSETTQHLADTLLMFNYDVDDDEESGEVVDSRYRTLSIAQKNRNGGTRETARFEMTDEGLLVPAPKLLDLEEDRLRKPSRFEKDGPPRLYPVK